MKKQLAAFLAMSLCILSACAVENGVPEEQLDEDSIETVEQAYGEATCATATISSPNGGTWVTSTPACTTYTSPSALYSNTGCTKSYIAASSNLGVNRTTASAIIKDEEPIEGVRDNASQCAIFRLKATVYRDGLPSIPFDVTAGFNVITRRCIQPQINTGWFALSGGYRIVAQAYESGTFPLDYSPVSITHGHSCP